MGINNIKMENTIKLTDFLTGLPVSVDSNGIDTYRGSTGYTAIYFKDDSMGMVMEDFDTVDELVKKSLKQK